jgi:serine-type D-Ala-D-Ala carboxypeptidase/endopeptidase (penicillin-binding protein 4)
MMKALLLIGSFLSLATWANDPQALNLDFNNLLNRHGLTPLNDQAYCYELSGFVHGVQVDKLQRIASVTKLLTTYHAAENLDLNRRFETRLFISGDRLHIEGSRDPYFEEEKLLLMMQALNDLGYRSFKSVTFNKDFIFSDAALGSHQDITPAHTKSRLETYLNPVNAKFIRGQWLAAAKFAMEEDVHLDKNLVPSLAAASVALVEANPLKDMSAIIYIHRSRALRDILKSMNVMSKNIVAQNVFLEASRVKTLDTLMASKGIDKSTFKIYNGSGLPIKTSRSRTDNLASCRTVLKVINLLDQSLKRQGLEMSDVVAVNGGKDLGSFRERFLNYPETHEAVISKTGTLMHASSLAGVILTETIIPFAILNHTSSIASSRKFQDQLISRMFHHLGEPLPLNYQRISIFPWQGENFLELGN